MITAPGSIWGALRDRFDNKIFQLVGVGPPTSLTGLAFAGLGSTYTDSLTGINYSNRGTWLIPSWSAGAVGFAKATYDFSVDGGAATSTITPVANTTIPIGAVILGGVIDVVTPLVGAGSVSIGTSAGSSATSIKAALAAASYTGLVAVIPLFTAATMFKMTAAGQITFTTTVGIISAGKMNVLLEYMVG